MKTYYIYKIININGDVYYGVTCQGVKIRVSQHAYYGMHGTASCKYFDWDNVTYEEVELLWTDKRGAEMVETEYILNNPCINQIRSYMSKEEHKEYEKRYYIANKERISKRASIYGKNNKEKKAELLRRWRSNNPDKVAEHNRNKRLLRLNISNPKL